MLNAMSETSTHRDLEAVLLPKIETSIREREPIALTGQDVLVLSSALIEAGVNLEIEDREVRESLFEGKELRAKAKLDEEGDVAGVRIYDRRLPEGERWIDFNPEQEYPAPMFKGEKGDMEDRGFGILATLGHKRFGDLVKWCYEEAQQEDYHGKIGGHEGTEGRGLQQAAADILAISTLNPEHEGFRENLEKLVGRLNRRLWKGYRKTLGKVEKEEVGRKFIAKGYEEPVVTLASFPPRALPEVFRFLVQR